jgi:hypothetical protein
MKYADHLIDICHEEDQPKIAGHHTGQYKSGWLDGNETATGVRTMTTVAMCFNVVTTLKNENIPVASIIVIPCDIDVIGGSGYWSATRKNHISQGLVRLSCLHHHVWLQT